VLSRFLTALPPYAAAAVEVGMMVEKALLKPVVVVGGRVLAEPAEEDLGEQEQTERLPIGDLAQAEYLRHQPVPEPFYDEAENEGKECRGNNPKKTECEQAEHLPSHSSLSNAFRSVVFHRSYLPNL
jgi:hypothetical protein